MPAIAIPDVLRRYSGGEARLVVRGSTAREALEALPAALRERVLDEQGRLQPYLVLVLDGARVESLDRALAPGDRLEILAAAGGG